MKTNKCPLRMPRPPRCLCTSFAHFVLGLVSPSLYFKNLLNSTDPEVIKFFEKQKKYFLDVLEWKINNRTATKQEYKQWKKENECKKV